MRAFYRAWSEGQILSTLSKESAKLLPFNNISPLSPSISTLSAGFPRQYFQDRADADWQRLLTAGDAPDLKTATIHEAKGKEYDAVRVVIPPDFRESRRTEQLITAWQQRIDDEPKRVVYVGITRARKLGTIAIPTAFRDCLTDLLRATLANFRVHIL